MPGAPLFIPMLAEHGAFADACAHNKIPCVEQELMISNVFNVGFLVTIATTLPIGLFFDQYGGYACGVLGASLVVVSSILLGVALCVGFVPGTLLFLLVMLSDIGTFVAGYSFFSFIWHFPQHQTFVLSLQTSSYQVSAALPVVFEAIIQKTNLSFGNVLIVYGFLCCLCLFGFMWAVPTQAEYFAEAKAVLGLPLPAPPKEFDFRGAVDGATRTLRVHKRHHCEFIVVCVFATAATVFFQSSSDVIGRALFDTDEAGKIFAVLTVSANVLIGIVVSPFVGGLTDAKGLPIAMWALGVSLLLTLFAFYPSWIVASIVIFNNQFFIGVSPTVIQKYFVQYATPQRLGSVIGLFMAICSALGVAVVGVLTAVAEGDSHFIYVVETALCIAALLWCVFSFRYCSRSPPSSVVLLDNDEAELAKSFPGCKNLDDVLFLTGYPQKATLLQKLTSPRLEDFVEVVGRVDEEKVGTLLNRLTAEELMEQVAGEAADCEESLDGEHPDLEATFLRAEFGSASKEEEAETMEMPLLKDMAEAASPLAVGVASKPSLPVLLGREPSLTVTNQKFRSSEQLGEASAQHLIVDEKTSILRSMIIECISKQDAPALRYVLLSEDVTLLTAVWRGFDKDDCDEALKLEKQLDALLPPKQIVEVLRKRPELKPLVVEATKQTVKKKARRMKSKLRVG